MFTNTFFVSKLFCFCNALSCHGKQFQSTIYSRIMLDEPPFDIPPRAHLMCQPMLHIHDVSRPNHSVSLNDMAVPHMLPHKVVSRWYAKRWFI